MICTKGSSWKGMEAAGRRASFSEEQRMILQADGIGWKRIRKGFCTGEREEREVEGIQQFVTSSKAGRLSV